MTNYMCGLIYNIGHYVVFLIQNIGSFFLFCLLTLKYIIHPKEYISNLLYSFLEVLFYSLAIIALTSFCTGAVLTVHTYAGLTLFKDEKIIAEIVSLAIMREIGPIIVGIIIASKTTSWITSELASMRITEQIDALSTMGVKPHAYLILPKVLACLLGFPIALFLTDLFGLFGSYFVVNNYLDLNGWNYVNEIINIISPFDFKIGFYKAIVFSLITSFVSCYKGYNAMGGTRGVGICTTSSIVIILVLILIANYFITVGMTGDIYE